MVIRFHLFGSVDLRGPDGARIVSVLAQPKRTALLAYLASARAGGFVQRETLLAVFWPDLDNSRARNALSKALHHLRRSLGEEAVVTVGDGKVGISKAHLWSDVGAFRAALKDGDPAGAFELYERGAFLEGFTVFDLPDFERWVDGEREALRRRAGEALALGSDAAEAAGNLARAVALARGAVSVDPYNEVGLRRLLALLDRMGDRGGAVQAYGEFAARLEADLELSPAPETVALERAIRARDVAEGVEEQETAEPGGGEHIRDPGPPEVRRSPLPPGRGRPATGRAAVLGGVTILALLGVVGAGWILVGNRASGPGPATLSLSPSLAVLPFDNLSPDQENAYLAAGIHEEILTHLSRVEGIRLIWRASVLRYDASERSLSEIAGELGVSTVMLGSVQRSGDRLRVMVNLIDAASGELVWAERYDRHISDLFAIQTDLAVRIVEELRGVLTLEERAALAEVPTDNMEAYAHFLRGHEHFRRMWSEQDVRASAEAYQRAVDLDPGFAPAWARVVQSRIWLGWQYRSGEGKREQWTHARAALDALERLAPESPDLRFARGVWLHFAMQRYEEALEEYEALATLWPGATDATRFRGAIYRRLGRWEDAVRTWEEVLDHDPADATIAEVLGETFLLLRRFDEAKRYTELATSLDPTVVWHWVQRIRTLHASGDTASARAVLDSAYLRWETPPADVGVRVVQLYVHGAEEALTRITGEPDRGFATPRVVLAAAVAVGRNDVIPKYADTLRIRAERRLADDLGDNPNHLSNALAALALAHAYLGNEAEAVRRAREAVSVMPVTFDAYHGQDQLLKEAWVLTAVGRHDEAVDRLRYLLSIPARLTVHDLRLNTEWIPLRDHPGFRALVEEHG